MRTRSIGPFQVSAIGFGCMSLSHGHGPPPSPAEGARVLQAALDAGYTHFDTAALYGFGANETLVGEALSHRRGEFMLASKCGVFRDAAGKREIDGRPETLKRTCEDSLRRLRTDVIDLYYLHRWDKRVPIEDSIGALSDLVTEGKVRTLGLSEVSAQTLRRAHAVHPIVAVQTEYSLWTRNAEVAVLDACRELGAAFVAFGALARGFLADAVHDMSKLTPDDVRQGMPRFQSEHFAANLRLLPGLREIASRTGVTPAQLALAWLLAQGEDITPIPGTKRLDHLQENAAADAVRLAGAELAALDELINPTTVSGPRYNAANTAEIDTEELPA